MKNIIKIVVFASVSFIFYSCKSDDKEIKNDIIDITLVDSIEKNDSTTIAIQKNISFYDSLELSFLRKHNSKQYSDTIEFSYQYEKKYIDSANLLLIKGDILDIFKLDNSYFLKIMSYPRGVEDFYDRWGYGFNVYIYEAKIDKYQFVRLDSLLGCGNYSKYNGCFALKLLKTKNKELKLERINSEGFSNKFIKEDFYYYFSAKVVDFILTK